jgi:hypothetical protein
MTTATKGVPRFVLEDRWKCWYEENNGDMTDAAVEMCVPLFKAVETVAREVPTQEPYAEIVGELEELIRDHIIGRVEEIEASR